ncbi:HK97 gp10 family phage protein [Chryseobacterium gallinarum]|uniref:HK97 gp10 family phage protein n=1 Tax=Chryseobacterium gallinarum TaxID=1324352 RepID=A0ABX6KUG0_CHRGL|nr:HK97 gp10 family phage protein [Chryseobacterium gallinarum]QIY92241.1 HK97 gp10 family phage protein [Chryseobacterium gallinarum]
MRVNGLRETLARLNAFGEQGKRRIQQITAVSGQEIATRASQNLSSYQDVDQTGTIAQSINARSDENGFKTVISVNQVPMGAYIEFGTGTYVEVADEWKDIAWQFYVNGRGQLHPHPYFYPAFNEGRNKYLQDLQEALQRLAREFNSTN